MGFPWFLKESAAVYYSGLNSLNMLHNHPLVPKRKRQFLVISLASTFCLKLVTLQTHFSRYSLVQICWEFTMNQTTRRQQAHFRTLAFWKCCGRQFESSCSVLLKCFYCTFCGEMKGWVGRKLTRVVPIWNLSEAWVKGQEFSITPVFPFLLLSPLPQADSLSPHEFPFVFLQLWPVFSPLALSRDRI